MSDPFIPTPLFPWLVAPKAVIGAVMHKLAHLIYGVIKSGKPFDDNYGAFT